MTAMTVSSLNQVSRTMSLLSREQRKLYRLAQALESIEGKRTICSIELDKIAAALDSAMMELAKMEQEHDSFVEAQFNEGWQPDDWALNSPAVRGE